MATLLAIPVLGVLLILQSAVLSQIPLLQGTTDLVLMALIAWAVQKQVQSAWYWGIIGGLMVGFVSALPLGAVMLGYLVVVGMAVFLKQRVWQWPILTMFVVTFFGTFLVHLVAIIALRIAGTPLPFWQSINLITLPSVLLNLLLAAPFYAVFGDLASWLYPEELAM
jgi:rod shape-determining protein MreD